MIHVTNLLEQFNALSDVQKRQLVLGGFAPLLVPLVKKYTDAITGLGQHGNEYHSPDFAADSDLTTHTGAAAPHSGHEEIANKGAAEGYPELDAGALVPSDQLGTGGEGAGAKILADDQTFKTIASAAVPTGTGFRHVTADTEDGTVKLVENADVHATAGIVETKLALNYPTINDGRIERTSDVLLSWIGYRIGLFNSTTGEWPLCVPSSTPTLANTDLDLDGNAFVPDFNYDIFAERVSDTEFTLVAQIWTNDTTRAVTPAFWHGRLCYDNTTDAGKGRLYLGTIRLRNDAGTAKFTDTTSKRFISNLYNPKLLTLQGYNGTAGVWNYNGTIFRESNNGTGMVRAECVVHSSIGISVDTAGQQLAGAAGDDAVIAAFLDGVTNSNWITNAATTYATTSGSFLYTLTPGYHYITIKERVAVSANATFVGYGNTKLQTLLWG